MILAAAIFFRDKPKLGLSLAQTIINGAIHAVCQIMKHVMGSASEAEIGAGYINTIELIQICTSTIDMGHPQPSTPYRWKI